MAKMIPPSIFSDTRSPGEVEIFERLKSDPITQDWVVLHSLDIAKHTRQVSGEADFVIIIPQKGILCLEVKACRTISRDNNGLWYLGSKNPEKRGPFRQAEDAMHSIKQFVWKADWSLKKIVFCSAVIFPYTPFDLESPEWHSWQAIDQKLYNKKPIGEIILNILNKTREHLKVIPSAKWFDPKSTLPNSQQVSQITEILRPSFEFYESSESRSNRRKAELKQYTQEQFDALDSMESNPRVIFTGPAGTGKTLLALELVRRKSFKNKKILFLCHNRLLRDWLEEETWSLHQLVKTTTIQSIMLAVSGVTPDYTDKHFSKELLPKQALAALAYKDQNEYLYDVIVVDEAQDILNEYYLDFLDKIVKGGLASGNVYFFGDFEKQAIYQENPLIIIKNRLANYPNFSLRVNCRNTPRIAEFVQLLGDLKPGYTRVRRPDNQIEPKIILYNNQDNQQNQLEQELEHLLIDEKYNGKDIVLISPYSDDRSIAGKLPTIHKALIKPIDSLTSTNQIGYCSIHLFKGLESPVIVVTDIDDVKTERAKKLFYTAITRAVEKLIIFVNESVREEMLEIISSKQGKR